MLGYFGGPQGIMDALVIATRVFCLLPFATGLADLIVGVRVFETAGLTLRHGCERHP